jgi:DNA polymerase III psi subunit
VAQQDEDAAVRRIAVAKLDDPSLLATIARTDSDPGLRELASARTEGLLAEIAISDRDVGECLRALDAITEVRHLVTIATSASQSGLRRAALAKVSDEKALARIARNATDAALGLDALRRVVSPPLLRRIAGSSAPSEVALAALERLNDPETLRAITEERTAQRSVRRRARAKLADVLDDQQPLRVAKVRRRQVELCVAVERPEDPHDPERMDERLARAGKEWLELVALAGPEPELESRFQHARAHLVERMASVQARESQRQRREEERRQGDEARERLCAFVESLEGEGTPQRLEQARAEWESLRAAGPDLTTRFTLAVERCEQRYERWQARDAFRSRVEAVVEEAEGLIQAERPEGAVRLLQALKKRWAALESSAEGRKWMAGERALGERFARAGETLQDRRAAKHEAEERRKQQNLRDIAALCSKLEGLSGSELPSRRGAERLLQEAADALSRLGPLPSSENPDLWRQRLSAAHEGLSRRLGEHEAAEQWRLWSNAQAQERLIQRAQELLACSDLRRVLKEVAELQQDWERVAAAPRDQSQALWDSFRTARDELRRRGGEYLAVNLKTKQTLCEEAERLAESSDWERTAADIRRLQAEWKQIGPVLQRHSKPLWARFRAPCNRFFERREAQREALGKQRETNAAAKVALCEMAEALADSTDWDEAAAEIKRLQAEWKQIGPVPREQSDTLWNRFRAACDRFLERYGRRDELVLEEATARAESILHELFVLGSSIGSGAAIEPAGVGRRLGELLAAWRGLGTMSPGRARELNERLQNACETIEAVCPQELRDSVFAGEHDRKQRERLCTRLERVIASLEAIVAEPSSVDLAERLRQAMAANTIGGAALPDGEKARRAAVEEGERLHERWERLGPIVGPANRALAARFHGAYAHFRDLAAGGSASDPQ